jgi:hypothetical protein
MKPDFYTCRNCHKENCGMYMLRNDLWEQIWKDSGLPVLRGAGLREILCWKCAEGILDRRLSARDLNPNSNCNEVYFILFDRMQKADDYIQGCLV